MKKWSDLSKKEKTRGIIALIIFGFIILMLISPSPEESEETNTANTVEAQQNTEIDTTLPPVDQIKQIATQNLQGQNNMDRDNLRTVEVTGDETDGYIVDVEFNASDNLTSNFRKTGIEETMSEVYTALYNSEFNINMVRIGAYFPLVDEYGNESDGLVYKSVLPVEEAEKVNWEAPESTLQLSILPSVWTTTSLHQEFR